jgi:hypothetical protein
MERTLFVIFLLSSLFSCTTKSDTKDKVDQLSIFNNTVDSLFNNSVEKPLAYIVLPNAGCSGCISSAEKLLFEYVTDTIPVKFILTNINSYKALRNTFGDSILLNPLVYADKTNLFHNIFTELQKIYPIIFYTDEARNAKYFEYVNPDNPDAIEKFKKHIDSSISTFK